MQPNQKRPQRPESPDQSPPSKGLTLPLYVEWETLEKAVRTACWKQFSNAYPLTRDAAANFAPETSADDAIRMVRNLAARVVQQYFPRSTFTKAEIREEVIALEAYMAFGTGIDCNLPGHERRDSNPPTSSDMSSLRFPA